MRGMEDEWEYMEKELKESVISSLLKSFGSVLDAVNDADLRNSSKQLISLAEDIQLHGQTLIISGVFVVDVIADSQIGLGSIPITLQKPSVQRNMKNYENELKRLLRSIGNWNTND